jgi:hypothetical protein
MAGEQAAEFLRPELAAAVGMHDQARCWLAAGAR